jgi:hypothetical protein
MITPKFVDTIFLIVAFLAPIYFVFRCPTIWIAMTLGTLTNWIVLLLAGVVLSKMDNNREAAMIDSFWLLFGWVVSIGYCGILVGIKFILKRYQHLLWRIDES